METRGLIKSFGGLVATDNVSLEVEAGEVHALIGPNGAGKTTLIGQITGELKADGGQILFAGRDITRMAAHKRSHLGLARSFQITNLCPDFTVLENVMLAVQAHAGHSYRLWKNAVTETDLLEPALAALKTVGLQKRADVITASLSHGEQRQVELAVALATRPKMLLLDEPMAGMGAEETASMVKMLKGLKKNLTMLLVEHDMDTVFALADRISVLVYGRVIATGTPKQIRDNAKVREAYLGEEAA